MSRSLAAISDNRILWVKFAMIHISEIVLNGERIEISENQIVCFVGPNGSGKSTALTKVFDLFHQDDGGKSQLQRVIIKNGLKRETIDEYISEHINLHPQLLNTVHGLQKGDRAFNSQRDMLLQSRFKNFKDQILTQIDHKKRLDSIEPTAYPTAKRAVLPPIQYMYYNPSVEIRLSQTMDRIYGKQISLNPGAGAKLTLHIGPRVDAAKYGGNRDQTYANEVGKLPLIQSEGDGVKAAAGLLSKLLGSNCKIFLIDEPDIYLHPPQSYSVARTIVKEMGAAQLFIATHSSRFVQGLADADPERLLLIRLAVMSGNYTHSIVDNSVFYEIKSTPILKFNNVIDSMFFGRTFVCEESSDCLFYRTSLERLGHPVEDTFWIGVSGKSNLPRTVRTLRALQVSPITICDFDILRDKEGQHRSGLLPLIEAHGGDVATLGDFLETVIYPQIKANGKLTWEILKLQGVGALAPFGQIYGDVSRFLHELSDIGIVVNPFGEVESLRVPRVDSHGSEAINTLLSFDITNDATLENARTFSASIGRKLG